jgi:hypothetical protein
VFIDIFRVINYQYYSILSGDGLLLYEDFQYAGISHTLFTRVSYFLEALILIIKFPFGFGSIGGSFQYAQLSAGVFNVAPGQAHSAILDIALCYGVFVFPIFFLPFFMFIFMKNRYKLHNYNIIIILSFNFISLLFLTESGYGLFFCYLLSFYGFLFGLIFKIKFNE